MRNTIKNILKENELEWIEGVQGAPKGITILDPKSKSNPKNSFRVHMTHSHGEGGGTWADNWFNIKQEDTTKLSRILCLLIALEDGGVYELVRLVKEEGEMWIVADYDLTPEELQNDDDVYDVIYEFCYDWGLIEFDHYSQDDAGLEKFWVTYFDENGIEHKTKIDKRELWLNRG